MRGRRLHDPTGGRRGRAVSSKGPRLRPDEDYGVDERHREHPDERVYLADMAGELFGWADLSNRWPL